jgi:dTDP-4-dehydrorhamnose 3,5-epimerase
VNVVETGLPGVLLVEPDVFGDERGFFMELYNRERYREAGLEAEFVQDNLSYSRHGILRGLHFQNPDQQGKLVYVLEGEVFDVAADIREGSPHFGEWVAYTLSSENKRQLYVPKGFAHGFVVTSEAALLAYKCTALYNRQADAAVRWDDPRIGIDWPLKRPELSEKDRNAPLHSQMPYGALPRYG